MSTSTPHHFICPICEKEPESHSFVELSHNSETRTRIFYTCPAAAKKYDDYEGILVHYDGILSECGDAPWIWVFDAKGFSTKHLLEIRVGIGLAKLITTKYSHNLEKICVINANRYIFMAHHIIKNFLPQKVNDSILICGTDHGFTTD
jgi:hypothetical protein